MNALVINIPAIAALCYIIAQYIAPPIISFIKGRDRRTRQAVKPFECPFCLSFWVGLVIFVYQYGYPGIAYACLSAVIAALIDRNL